jgi:hydrogenase nickel incorporation protein HypA/HybF
MRAVDKWVAVPPIRRVEELGKTIGARREVRQHFRSAHSTHIACVDLKARIPTRGDHRKVDKINPRMAWWRIADVLDQCGNSVRIAFGFNHHSFSRIDYPTGKSKLGRTTMHEGAESDALHGAVDNYAPPFPLNCLQSWISPHRRHFSILNFGNIVQRNRHKGSSHEADEALLSRLSERYYSQSMNPSHRQVPMRMIEELGPVLGQIRHRDTARATSHCVAGEVHSSDPRVTQAENYSFAGTSMHELALSQSIVDLVVEHARREGLHSVVRVTVEVGVAAGIEPDALRFCFDIVSSGTLAHGAELGIEKIGLQVRCSNCECEFEPPRLVSACPGCGSYARRLLRGREFRIRSFDGE